MCLTQDVDTNEEHSGDEGVSGDAEEHSGDDDGDEDEGVSGDAEESNDTPDVESVSIPDEEIVPRKNPKNKLKRKASRTLNSHKDKRRGWDNM